MRIARASLPKIMGRLRHYSEPTPSVILTHHQNITNSLFDNVDLDNLVAQGSKEIQGLYKDSLHISGALTEVLGETCVFMGTVL